MLAAPDLAHTLYVTFALVASQRASNARGTPGRRHLGVPWTAPRRDDGLFLRFGGLDAASLCASVATLAADVLRHGPRAAPPCRL
jgi:hypothetical protein